jgi:CelD/BcsL family acetyltransferase involved in cellulose biosynthesis
MMKIQVLQRQDDLADLSAEWDQLALEDTRDGFFRTSVWYRAWMTHIRPDAEPHVLTLRDDAGRLVGLAPLCRLRYRDLGFRLNALAWAGREVVSGDFLDFLAAPVARPQVVGALLDAIWASERSWSLLVLGELLDGGDSYRSTASIARERGASVRRQEERLCPYIELPGSFDDYLATLGTSTRYHIRRRMRDVEKKGAVVRVYSEPGALVARLDTLVELHLARWRRDHQPGTFGRPGFVPFLKEVFLHLPASASARLYELEHEGRVAASLLTFAFGDSVLYYQAGWHPDSSLSALSPGVVLMAHSIRDAIQTHARYYEFLRGDEAYKSRWTQTARTTATLLVARRAMARGFLQTARVKDSVKHHPLFRRHLGSNDHSQPAGEQQLTTEAS